jgi:hypothetical protein
VELLDKVKQQFATEAAAQCDKASETLAGVNEPEVSAITYRLKGEDAKSPQHKASLFKFVCSMAAYNETDIFYLADDSNGIRRLSFPEPQFDITYADSESAKLKSLRIRGFSSSAELTNAGYDAKSHAITSFAKWRGIGDAFSAGSWVFNEGAFVLESYDVDPTYDDKQNPVTVVKAGQIVLKP